MKGRHKAVMKKTYSGNISSRQRKNLCFKKLAENLRHIVYLDKDTLIPLSRKIFEAACEEYDRSSDFFEKYVRNAEYEAILALAFEALEYESLVLINAPFTREIRDPVYMKDLAEELRKKEYPTDGYLGRNRYRGLPPENDKTQFRPRYLEACKLGRIYKNSGLFASRLP